MRTQLATGRFPNTNIKSSESLTAEAIYHAGLDGDQLALEVFQQMGKHLGVGLATVFKRNQEYKEALRKAEERP